MLEKIIKQLPQLEVAELTKLQTAIHTEITSRNLDYTFKFESTSDPRKGYPYVAHITGLDENGKFTREFKDLDRTYGKKSVTVSGNYTAKTGDILEIQEGGSWKNNYREFYIVDDNGQLGSIGHYSSSQTQMKIKKYLRGERSLDDFFIN